VLLTVNDPPDRPPDEHQKGAFGLLGSPSKTTLSPFDCVSLYERLRWKGGPLHAQSEDPGALTGQDALKPTEAYVDDASEARRRREFAPITAV